MCVRVTVVAFGTLLSCDGDGLGVCVPFAFVFSGFVFDIITLWFSSVECTLVFGLPVGISV